MIINEIITEKSPQSGNFLEILEQFVRFASDYLEIDQLPKLVPRLQVESPDQPTFGELSYHKHEILFAIENRHPMDILRTLAHELVHWRQHLNNESGIHNGETGSPTENEANSEAGKMLRLFAKQHPEYLEHPAVDLVSENFADGKNPGRRGLSRRVGIPRKATLARLEKIAQSSTGERRRMAQWQLNMRRGRARKGKK